MPRSGRRALPAGLGQRLPARHRSGGPAGLRVPAGQVGQHRRRPGGVGGQVTHDHHLVGGHLPVPDHRYPDRPVGGEVVAGLAEPLRDLLGQRRRVVPVRIHQLQRQLAGAGKHLPGPPVRSDPQPGPQGLVAADQEPQVGHHLVDRGAGRQWHGPADRQPAAQPPHRLPEIALPPGQLLLAGALAHEPDGYDLVRHASSHRLPPRWRECMRNGAGGSRLPVEGHRHPGSTLTSGMDSVGWDPVR
jgi:hypothetical protein